MNKLIILVTNSLCDRGILVSGGRIKNVSIAYIDCGSGNSVNNKSIQNVERLLCVILLLTNKTKNTENVIRVLEECSNFDAVVGTHRVSPENVLNIDQINQQYPQIKFKKYSTAWGDYRFVEDFCKELVKQNPNYEKIKSWFDELFNKLKGEHSVPWRLEYFIELSQRLLSVKDEENKNEIKKLLEDYEKKLNEEEKGSLKEIRNFINELPLDKDILDQSYKEKYDEIYKKLKELAQDEINKFLLGT